MSFPEPRPRPPAFWSHVQSGPLKPAIEAYMRRESLDVRQVGLIRDYLRQWVMAPKWDENPHLDDAGRAELAELRLLVDVVTSQSAIERWIWMATRMGIDPL